MKAWTRIVLASCGALLLAGADGAAPQLECAFTTNGSVVSASDTLEVTSIVGQAAVGEAYSDDGSLVLRSGAIGGCAPSPTITSTGGDRPVGVPTTLVVHPARPNPFNPRTEIAFALPQAGPVELVIFDTRGRLVTTLIDERLDAGEHAIVWQGRDDTGRSVASGTYIMRLRSSGGVRTGKLSLLK